jgi:predicted RNase H-like HicB family nuclease
MDPSTLPRYRVALYRAQGCYFARVLELPGCIARGATEVEAVENARGAIRFHLWIAQVLAEDRATVEVEIRA